MTRGIGGRVGAGGGRVGWGSRVGGVGGVEPIQKHIGRSRRKEARQDKG